MYFYPLNFHNQKTKKSFQKNCCSLFAQIQYLTNKPLTFFWSLRHLPSQTECLVAHYVAKRTQQQKGNVSHLGVYVSILLNIVRWITFPEWSNSWTAWWDEFLFLMHTVGEENQTARSPRNIPGLPRLIRQTSLWFLERNATRVLTLEARAEQKCREVQHNHWQTPPIPVLTQGPERCARQRGPGWQWTKPATRWSFPSNFAGKWLWLFSAVFPSFGSSSLRMKMLGDRGLCPSLLHFLAHVKRLWATVTGSQTDGAAPLSLAQAACNILCTSLRSPKKRTSLVVSTHIRELL